MDAINKYDVVCFGEVLWDIFPSGAVPGGAPMNVAYHLHKQHKPTALITKIGIDEEGEKLIDVFAGKGICVDYFQVDYEYETGKVYAKQNDNKDVVYDIVMPVAWDFINLEKDLKPLVQSAEFFVYGSLAARNKTSKDTLFSLLEVAKNKVLDINLRPPHFNRRAIEDLLHKADMVKMNLSELEFITGWVSRYISTEDRIKAISEAFSIPNVVVTMRSNGAMLYMNGEMISHNGFKVDMLDRVGCGEAFLAGLLGKLIDNRTKKEALDFAARLGAFMATQRGACPEYELPYIDNLFKEYNF